MGDFNRIRIDDSDKNEEECTRKESKPEFSEDDTRKESKPGFSEDEEMLMARMYRLVGPRWSLIAGRIPGRTPEEIEKYFTSKYASTSN